MAPVTNTAVLASPEQDDLVDPAACGLDPNLGPPSRRQVAGPATYTADEVAALLGVSTWAIYQSVRRDECPLTPIRIGRRLVWPRSQVDAVLGTSQPDTHRLNPGVS